MIVEPDPLAAQWERFKSQRAAPVAAQSRPEPATSYAVAEPVLNSVPTPREKNSYNVSEEDGFEIPQILTDDAFSPPHLLEEDSEL